MDAAERSLKLFAKLHGFRTRGRNFWLEGEDLVRCLNLQRSQRGGNEYYLNIGWAIRELTPEPRPTFAHWDIVLRLEDVFEDEHVIADLGVSGPAWASALLNLDAETDGLGTDTARESAIAEFLERYLWPLLERTSSIAAVKAMLADGSFPTHTGIQREAHVVLGLR